MPTNLVTIDDARVARDDSDGDGDSDDDDDDDEDEDDNTGGESDLPAYIGLIPQRQILGCLCHTSDAAVKTA